MPHKKSIEQGLPARRRIQKVVYHPRYGDEVISTGCKATASEVLASYRNADKDAVFVESAIRADLRRQNYHWTNPKHFYADVLCRCTKCRRRFIFFAREQQFWYEELKINVATTARYCFECASENREIDAALERYKQKWGKADLTDEELIQLGCNLATLRRAEVLKDDQRLRRVRNALTKRKIDPARMRDLLDVIGS